MSDMVDKVAAALEQECRANNSKTNAEGWHLMARAAIEAMREPSLDMTADAAYIGYDDAKASWRVMIDAALREAST